MTGSIGLPRFVVVDPGHFHAALLQKEMPAGLAPEVQVLAPLGPDLLDYLGHISRFNNRGENPTGWRLDVQATPDFLDRLGGARPGDIAVFSGRNHNKIARMRLTIEAGLHVIADKPIIIEPDELQALEDLLNRAEQNGLVMAQIAGGHDGVTGVLRALCQDPDVFGEPVAGSPDEPTVEIASVHHLMKEVAGVPNLRPPWYFDVGQQGEGLADTTTHLVDRAHNTLFPNQAIDYRREVEMLAAERRPTAITSTQFQEVTGTASWPDYLEPALRAGVLKYSATAGCCTGSTASRSGSTCGGTGALRPGPATRIRRCIAAAVPGSKSGRALRNATGRSCTLFLRPTSPPLSNAASPCCRRITPASGCSGWAGNGGSISRIRSASATTNNSPLSSGAFSPMPPTRPRSRHGTNPICSRSILSAAPRWR